MDFRPKNLLQRPNLLSTTTPRPVVNMRGCRHRQGGWDVQGARGCRQEGWQKGWKEGRQKIWKVDRKTGR